MGDKKIFIFVVLICLIGFISSIPYILFVQPTPENNYQTNSSFIEINSTMDNITSLDELIWNWDGTNYSLYDQDLILMMNFENNAGIGENNTFIRDLSKYGNNGSVLNGAEFLNAKYGKGIYFQEVNQLVNLSDSSELHSHDMTISFWVNLTGSKVKQIAIAYETTYFLMENGDVYSVGNGYYGQLGEGSNMISYSPVKVAGGYNFSYLSSTYFHTCGLLHNGSALCWGYNGYSGLGIGNTTTMFTPSFVLGGQSFINITTGYDHTCGLLENGSALCWGVNWYGELGTGDWEDKSSPTFVVGDYNFSSIYAGGYQTCGLLHNGSALCWGANYYAQLGVGDKTDREIPTFVLGEYIFKSLSLGSWEHTCGLLHNGSALCWGENFEEYGELGIGNQMGVYTPTFVLGGYNFSYLDSGDYHVCGLLENGSALCWGNNYNGQLGIGNETAMYFPTFVLGGYNFSSISVGLYDNYGILNNSLLVSWGTDTSGETGKGTPPSASSPIIFKYGDISDYVDISTSSHNCFLYKNGSLFCFGKNNYGQLGIGNDTDMFSPTFVLGEYNFKDVDVSKRHSCGLLENGSALCWGYNDYGQLGIGNITTMFTPSFVLGGYNFSSLNIGDAHTCGVLYNGSALCWGGNWQGQLGIGLNNRTFMYAPTFVSGDYNFSSLFLGDVHSCGTLHNGSALCWGYNDYGQLGDGTITRKTIPVFTYGNYQFSEMDLGWFHTCGLLYNGSALCWGENARGYLGIGNTTDMRAPTFVSGDYNFSSLSNGGSHNCGVLQNGSLYCWGINYDKELGYLENNYYTEPRLINFNNYNFSSIMCSRTGWYDSGSNFGVLTDGRIVTWGNNDYSQQGISPYINSGVPSKGIYKGNVLGKDPFSFQVISTFDNNLRVFFRNIPSDISLNGEYIHVTLVIHENNTLDIYKNGEFSDTIDASNSLFYYDDPSNIVIGEYSNGVVDELKIYNRSLSSDEVQQLYLSNLKKVNSSTWEFYSNETMTEYKNYSYGLFLLDQGTPLSLLRKIIRRVYTPPTPEEEPEDDPPSSGGGSTAQVQTQYQLGREFSEQGESLKLRKNYQVGFKHREGSHTLTVNSFTTNTAKITIRSDPITATLEKDIAQSFNIDDEEGTDVEITYQGTSGSEAQFFIKKIIEVTGESEVFANAEGGEVQERETNQISTDELFGTSGSGSESVDAPREKTKRAKNPFRTVLISLIIMGAIIAGLYAIGKNEKKKKEHYLGFFDN